MRDESEAPPSLFFRTLFFCTLQFRVLFRVLNPNLCRNTNTREAKLYARGRHIHSRETNDFCAAIILTKHTHAHKTHTTEHQHYYYSLKRVCFSYSIYIEKRRGEKERTFFPRYI